MTNVNRQWRVGALENEPGGFCLKPHHFVYGEAPVPQPVEGQVLIRATHFAPDPMIHAWARGVMPGLTDKFTQIPRGMPLRGTIGGRVVASRHRDWRVGDQVTGNLDWADYSLSDGTDHLGVALERVPDGATMESALATLGMTGLCAYFGLFDIGRPLPGDTVVVSGASGAIGSIAGQLAKLAGARAVGIAGGPAKCEMVLGLGFDQVIDYRRGDLAGQMAKTCPQGIDVYFDNVGGETLDAAMLNLAHGARIVVCGGMAHFTPVRPGIFNHMLLTSRAATMTGFYYFDLIARWPAARRRLQSYIAAGSLREVFDIVEGFAQVPAAAISQFEGGVIGRKLIRIDEGG